MSTYIATFDKNRLHDVQYQLEKANKNYAETEEQMVVGGVFFSIFGVFLSNLTIPLSLANSMANLGAFSTDSMQTLVYESIIKILNYRYLLEGGNYLEVKMQLTTSSIRDGNGQNYVYPSRFDVIGLKTKNGAWITVE